MQNLWWLVRLRLRFPPARVREMELVVEEMLVNICRHAYSDAPGEVEIRCVRADAEHLCVEFSDSGKPFNILASPAPDLRSTWTSVRWVVWESHLSAP